MTHEGGAISFVIRLLLGGALISGGLLYAAQALQKTPAPKEAVTEKIGPSLSTRQAAQPVRPALPAPEPTVPAASAETPPAALPQPRVSSSFAADPGGGGGPVTTASPAPTPAPPAPDGYGVMADDAPVDPSAEAKPARAAAARGQRGAQGCTSFKSYNPQTQTYRSFDGKIKDCRP